ncbi:MAG: type II toxin-antitoxin system HicB family antitoxin [Terracidiphilus sp.]|jgi:predicted RNase H-like HicB family nuclease
MLYPIYVQLGDEQHAHGIEFPDFPGCFSAADDWQEINRMAQEAVECHLSGESLPIPAPTPLEKLASKSDYEGGVWMLVDIDVSRIDPAPKRVNISLPGSLLSQIDDYTQSRHLSRSGFLAQAAQDAMSAEKERAATRTQ